MNCAVIVFPGTTGEMEVYYALKDIGINVQFVKHDEKSLEEYDCIILPGGTSYGDYLRPGAIASLTPVMEAVAKAIEDGKLIIGIGNGFQVLLEANLLPGAVIQNKGLKFICDQVELLVNNNETVFTKGFTDGETVTLPIAHQFGNYYCDDETLKELKENNQIIFTYKNDVNGSVERIAGITNKRGNVVGMMPHPERAMDTFQQTRDGLPIFQLLLTNWREQYNGS